MNNVVKSKRQWKAPKVKSRLTIQSTSGGINSVQSDSGMNTMFTS